MFLNILTEYFFFIDGLIENDAVVEIKCPYVAKDTTSTIEAVNNNLLSYLYVAMKYDVMIISNILYIIHMLYAFLVTILQSCV